MGLKWVRTECLQRIHYCIIIHIWMWKTEQSFWRKLHTNWRRPDERQPKFVQGNKCTYSGSHALDNWDPQWAFTQCELQMCISRDLRVMVTPIEKTYCYRHNMRHRNARFLQQPAMRRCLYSWLAPLFSRNWLNFSSVTNLVDWILC